MGLPEKYRPALKADMGCSPHRHGPRGDMAEALAFAAEGKVKADIELQPLSSINQVFERLEHGEVASRVVIDFTTTR